MSEVVPSPKASCPICLQPFSDPVSLPCGHAFCLCCLRTMGEGLDRHSCPDCHAEYYPQYYYTEYRPEYYHIQYYPTEYPGANRRDPKAHRTENTITDVVKKLRNQQDTRSKMEEEGLEEEGSGGFQNKTPLLTASGRESMRIHHHNTAEGGEMEDEDLERRVLGPERVRNNLQNIINVGEMEGEGLEEGGNGRFQSKTPLLTALGSETVKENHQNITADGGMEEEARDIKELQNKTPLCLPDDRRKNRSIQQNLSAAGGGMEEEGSEGKGSGEMQNKTPLLTVSGPESIRITHQNITAAGGEMEEEAVEREGSGGFQNKTPVSEEDQRKMSESKSKLASQVAHLTLELEKAESILKKEREYEGNVMAANAKLRENALSLVGEVVSSAQRFSEQVMKLIEEELGPGEAVVRNRVTKASEVSAQIKKAMLGAESMLKERDQRVFTSNIQSLESEIEKLKGTEQREETVEVKFTLAKVCPEIERLNSEFKDRFGEIQRSLRNTFNPSEVTFDPETVHPNLVLSEDLKTVKFSAKKQEYTPSPKRFTSFFQVLSTQSFCEGVHSWEVELEGAPWILGVCTAASLPRSGLPSALESSGTSWSLMWSSNLLTAFDRSRAVPLKKTLEVSRRVRVQLHCERRELDFYNVSQSSGTSLIYRFSVDLKGPVHLGYRMLSGAPKGRATICL